uniref:15-oxoprostaglandin 13-reductase n=1 Tax=Timema shepardi TaxID=629360 RepID=A0A7R9B631_TIMSH|nr:unnamed protein product [Timema shepardi]
MTKAKKFILARHFDGEPKESDLKLVEEELPPIKDGEILAEAVWLSVDPYMSQPPPRSLGPDDRVSYTRLRYVRPLLLASVVRPCELYTSQVRQTPPPSLSRMTVRVIHVLDTSDPSS